jgi:programmed cell death protein 4
MHFVVALWCALQMCSGFSRLLSAADDLVLDIPDAVHLLSLFLGR